jgi:hypothetical protein
MGFTKFDNQIAYPYHPIPSDGSLFNAKFK